ncbi:uncharacterized protein LOC108164548 [Drosophila miranda]|uniref:uncharacterized protein LOC108164548 n=1 Tax=Drosophila miranda TaxID=7229 RepID=UPI0007E5D8A9|nr:uncharacterized protein LOC108164548 [Drosophila miranda]
MPRVPYTWRQPDFPGDGSDLAWLQPTLLIICKKANLEQAIKPLLRTLKQPLAPRTVAAVCVHETMLSAFQDAVCQAMEMLHTKVQSHDYYTRALRMIACLQAETVGIQQFDDIRFRSKLAHGSPVIVCGFDQSFFSVAHPSTVVTLHTFRNAFELPQLVARERLIFASAAVWGGKMCDTFEATLQLPAISTVYINCHEVSLAPIEEYFEVRLPHVVMANHFHYEVLLHNDRVWAIVYPAEVNWQPSNDPQTEPSQEVPGALKGNDSGLVQKITS